jgi:aldehyde:ferredoxin oxidoreductase
MPFGHWGKGLRVNLTTGNIAVETLDEVWLRRYVGGWGFIAYYLLKELPAGVDPLGPDNLLVYATGPLTGQNVAGGGRHMMGARSPLTGGFSGSECGGFFGAELKRAGWDLILFEGVSPHPVYLWIQDDKVELRSAEHLWGLETGVVQARIREELSDSAIRVSQCGPAGERLVRISNVIHDATRAAGRTGLGAVMGSKRLRAVAVRGRQRPTAKDPEKVREMAHWFREHYTETSSAAYAMGGTPRMVRVNQQLGGLPTRNFQEGVFEGFEALSVESMQEKIIIGRDTCYGCPIRCKWIAQVDNDRFHVDPGYGGPEYETVGAFGSVCGCDDIEAVAMANQICNANGLDTIGTGMTIAFAMECFERGLIGTADTDGLELRFGNVDAMLAMVRKIAERDGFGDLLAEGSRRAAAQIGGNALDYSIQIKGQELAMHDPRVKYGHGIGIAVSPTGADHMNSVHDNGFQTDGGIQDLKPLGVLKPLPFDDLSVEKMAMLRRAIVWRAQYNITGICMFQAWTPPQISELLTAVTGWNTSVMEIWLAAERATDMARAFSAREGFGPEDDLIHPRLTQPLPAGAVAGKSFSMDEFKTALGQYYEMMGWDPATAAPTRAKLEELGEGWVADLLDA